MLKAESVREKTHVTHQKRLQEPPTSRAGGWDNVLEMFTESESASDAEQMTAALLWNAKTLPRAPPIRHVVGLAIA